MKPITYLESVQRVPLASKTLHVRGNYFTISLFQDQRFPQDEACQDTVSAEVP